MPPNWPRLPSPQPPAAPPAREAGQAARLVRSQSRPQPIRPQRDAAPAQRRQRIEGSHSTHREHRIRALVVRPGIGRAQPDCVFSRDARTESPRLRRIHRSTAPLRNRRPPCSGSAPNAWARVRAVQTDTVPTSNARCPRRGGRAATRRARAAAGSASKAGWGRCSGSSASIPLTRSAIAGGRRASPTNAAKLPSSSLRRITAMSSSPSSGTRPRASTSNVTPSAYTSSAELPSPRPEARQIAA